VLVDCLVMVGYALVASPLAQLVTNERRMRLQNRLFGSLFMAAGAALASSSR
jgi:homoserine/homoserine lactone efflux protein